MKNAKRYLAAALSLALFLALPLVSTQEAAAKSKGVKVKQLVQMTSAGTDADGSPYSVTSTYQFNKKGLNTVKVNSDGSRVEYTYNKSGYTTSVKRFDKKGLPEAEYIIDVKKGKPVSRTEYLYEDGVKKLFCTKSFQYKKGKLVKETYTSADGKETSVTTYKNGKYAKIVRISPYEGQTVEIYDKKGQIKSSTTTGTFSFDDGSSTTAASMNYINKYKKGRLVSVTATGTSTDVWTGADGYTYKDVRTVNEASVYKYKKDKLVKKTWTMNQTSSWSNSDGQTGTYVSTDSNTIDYTYKKGRLVREILVSPVTDDNGAVIGTETATTTYAYTKGGLLKSESSATVRATSSETRTINSYTNSYSYKKIAVNKKCVDAVKEDMKYMKYDWILGELGLINGIAVLDI